MKILEHSEVNLEILEKIVEIKKKSWDYSFREHLGWIEKNIRPKDLHFLLYEDNELIGYANLVHINVVNNKTNIPFIGIGNVCSKYKGRGDGQKLMKEVNTFIVQNNYRGLLFCKEYLIDFYRKFDWKLIKNLYPSNSVFTMVYNYSGITSDFVYNDRLF